MSADILMPESFSRRPTRLRDLKAPEARLNLPPLYAEEEKTVQQLESFEARFIENLRSFGGSRQAESAISAIPAPARAAIDRDLQAHKSRARIEKLKDIQASLDLAAERLAALPVGAHQTLIQLKGLIQSAQSQLTAVYTGQIALADAEGMTIVRPYLVQQVEKLDCVQTGKASHFTGLQAQGPALSEALKAPNPLAVMEKAALLALGQTVGLVMARYLALTQEGPSGSQADEALLLRQHQPSLQLLQRAARSQQEMLDRLRLFHGKLGAPQQRTALRLLENALVLLLNRALRELQGVSDVINLHLPALSPLLALLKAQHQRLSLTGEPDFLSRRHPQASLAEAPETPALPAGLRPLLAEYTLLTDKVVVAFEALSAQCQEKAVSLNHEGDSGQQDNLDELDALLF